MVVILKNKRLIWINEAGLRSSSSPCSWCNQCVYNHVPTSFVPSRIPPDTLALSSPRTAQSRKNRCPEQVPAGENKPRSLLSFARSKYGARWQRVGQLSDTRNEWHAIWLAGLAIPTKKLFKRAWDANRCRGRQVSWHFINTARHKTQSHDAQMRGTSSGRGETPRGWGEKVLASIVWMGSTPPVAEIHTIIKISHSLSRCWP